MKTPARTLGFLCLCFGFVAAAPQDDDYAVEVAGRLVDSAGQPVVGASAAMYWNIGASPPLSYEPMPADETGAFSGQVQAWRYPVGLTAYSEDGSLAGVALVEQNGLQSIEIVLRPSVRVTAKLTCEGLGRTPDWVNASFSVDGARIGDVDSDDGRLSATLPQGEVSWYAYDSWFSGISGQQTIDGTASEVDLGTLDIPAAFLATQQGKVLPEWSVSAARGVPLNQSSLVAHRGKWLLIEFWGYW